MFEIEDKGLEEFRSTLTYLEKNFPKESKQMIRKVGNKVKTIVKREFRTRVNNESGNAYAAIKRGKAFKDHSGVLTVRVYPSAKKAPHFHLIENGHRIVNHSGEELGFKEGYHVFDKAQAEIESNYTRIVSEELDKIFAKL